jgi:tRNA threonylcarbamoyladenosine biosynthesis protein TsaE
VKFSLTDYTKTEKLGENIAHFLLNTNEDITTVFFFGDLGSGKTTCVRAIARILGVKENIQSPTFALSNDYYTPENQKSVEVFSHVDMYRCQESCALGMPELSEKIEDESTVVLQKPHLLHLPHTPPIHE